MQLSLFARQMIINLFYLQTCLIELVFVSGLLKHLYLIIGTSQMYAEIINEKINEIV